MGEQRYKDAEKLPQVGDAGYTAGKFRSIQGCAVLFWNPRPKGFDLVGNTEALFHVSQLLIGNLPHLLIFRFVLSRPLSPGTSSSGVPSSVPMLDASVPTWSRRYCWPGFPATLSCQLAGPVPLSFPQAPAHSWDDDLSYTEATWQCDLDC